jgi:hypothetical protein
MPCTIPDRQAARRDQHDQGEVQVDEADWTEVGDVGGDVRDRSGAPETSPAMSTGTIASHIMSMAISTTSSRQSNGFHQRYRGPAKHLLVGPRSVRHCTDRLWWLEGGRWRVGRRIYVGLLSLPRLAVTERSELCGLRRRVASQRRIGLVAVGGEWVKSSGETVAGRITGHRIQCALRAGSGRQPRPASLIKLVCQLCLGMRSRHLDGVAGLRMSDLGARRLVCATRSDAAPALFGSARGLVGNATSRRVLIAP